MKKSSTISVTRKDINSASYFLASIQQNKLTALMSAYESVRPLELSEKQNWLTLLRAAALRFWLSLLERQLFPRTSTLTQPKDPLIFRQLLRHYR